MISEQHKEHIINVIEKLDINQQNIENKLQELSIFYITNKGKYDYELVKTYFDNLRKFIFSNDIPIPNIADDANNYKFIIYYNNYNESENSLLNRYIENSKYIINKHGGFEYLSESWTKIANESFNFICNEGEDKLIHLMLMNDKKLKCYENLLKLYPEPEPDIKNIMDMNPENQKNVNLIDLFSKV